MQRPKQQALAFLLGAVLVGGVLGFSADRVFRQPDNSLEAKRKRMYDDLELTPAQRASLDTVLDAADCQLDALYASARHSPLQPVYDSIKAARRSQTNAILNPEQRARLEARRRDEDARRDAERKRIRAACRK